MIYVGIDPGKTGAMAVLVDQAGPELGIEIWPTPMIPGAKKNRYEYNLIEIRNRFESLIGEATVFTTLEKSHPLPAKMRGGIANYHRGFSRGWEWMLVALRIPHLLVRPQEWQRTMHAGTSGSDTKQRSRQAAQRLFPGADELLKRTERSLLPDHNFCDALLLAEYGRRIQGGR